MHRLSYYTILIATWPLRLLPYRAIHRLGALLGTCAYYLIPKFRKRALSNLALATSLQLTEDEIRRHAIASVQNLMITCLEYAKFASEKDIHRAAACVNPEEAAQLMKEGKPVIFFCGHQSNWEVLFLEGTKRMPGVAIGRPIPNTHLYNWVLSIRQKYGGKMISRQNAVREGLRALKNKCFLGIVGDQGMPDSGYSSPFFGRTAWTSPIAAMLSHRTGSPIIVAATHRKDGKYYIHYSDPIWPDQNAPMETEIDRLMRAALSRLEDKIREAPGQWLWPHNRWKQQTADKLKRPFRHESILITVPKGFTDLAVFREIYPHEFLTVYAPEPITLDNAEIVLYSAEEDLLKRDYRFKLVYNLAASTKAKRHFKKLSAFTVVDLADLRALAKTDTTIPFSETLKKAVLRHAP